MTDLTTLAERIEGAARGSRELDLAIATASYEHGFPIYGERVNYDPDLWLERYGPITSSLDAAMSLAEGYSPPDILWKALRALSERHRLYINLWPANENYAQWLARYVAAAALRARGQSPTQTGGGDNG